MSTGSRAGTGAYYLGIETGWAQGRGYLGRERRGGEARCLPWARSVIQRFDLENSTGQDKVQGSPDQDGQRTGFLREWAKWAANGQEAEQRRGSDRGTSAEAQLRQSRAPRSTFGASTAAPARRNQTAWTCRPGPGFVRLPGLLVCTSSSSGEGG